MFGNIGWGEIFVLVVVGLVILGPERLPGAIRWTADALRQARDYVTGATNNLRDELGPEFDDLRGPLAETQRSAVSRKTQRRAVSMPSDMPASPRRRADNLSATLRSSLPAGESGALRTNGRPESPAVTSAGSSGT